MPDGAMLQATYAEPNEDACRSLWKAVINQMFEDATRILTRPTEERYPNPSSFKSAKDVYRLQDREQAEARRWLLSSSPDFNLVCVFAGHEPDYIRRAVAICIENDWRTPPSG